MTPVNNRQSKFSTDDERTIRPAVSVGDAPLHRRGVRRIKGNVDGTPLVGRLSTDCDTQTTPVSVKNYAARPKNLMDVAEEEPATFNESLVNIDCDFKVPSNCVAMNPKKQRRIVFDDLTVDEDDNDDAFLKFPAWSSSTKLQNRIKRQSFITQNGKVD